MSVVGGNGIPLWVTIAVLVILPALGWLSKSVADRMRIHVDERMGLTNAQQAFADALAVRVRDIESRMDRMRADHVLEVEEIRRTYREQLDEMRAHYEARIVHLEKIVERRKMDRRADDL